MTAAFLTLYCFQCTAVPGGRRQNAAGPLGLILVLLNAATLEYIVALGLPMWEPKYFTYFLNPRNHQPGIPLDFIPYHFYATYRRDHGRKEQITTVFDQVDQLLDTVRYIEAIRDQFTEKTGMIIDEIGTVLSVGLWWIRAPTIWRSSFSYRPQCTHTCTVKWPRSGWMLPTCPA